MENYLQEIGEGFDRYRSLREQGYSKEEALRESSKDLAYMLATEKVGGEYLKNSKAAERLFGKNGFVDKVDDDAYNRANNIGELANEYHDLLTKAEWAKYYKDIADSGKLNKPLGYEFVSYQDGIILYSKKVRTIGTANDYQIIDYWFADTDNVYDEVKKLQSTIDKSGGHYGERKIRQKLDEISGYYD